MSFVKGKPCLVHMHLQVLRIIRAQLSSNIWIDAKSTKSGQREVGSLLEHN